jgi:hypothetical protein
LQFDSRGEEAQAQQLDTVKLQPALTSSSAVTAAAQLIRSVFGSSASVSQAKQSQVLDTLEAVPRNRFWFVALMFNDLGTLGGVLSAYPATGSQRG